MTSDWDHWDPALAYFTHSWNMETAVQLRLYYYPMVNDNRNKRIQPMAAVGFPASAATAASTRSGSSEASGSATASR